MSAHCDTKQAGFALVDVMMGAVILVVALVGLIEAITLGSEMEATARRQTMAAQIASHEIELLRLTNWTTLQALAAATPPSSMTWSAATSYNVTDITSYTNTDTGVLSWYHCIQANSNHAPITKISGIWVLNSNYWVVYNGPIASTGTDSGATFRISRTVYSMPNNLVEVTFTVTWTVTPGGSTVSRTYTRIVTAYFGKYGLNLTYQRT